MLEDIRIKMDQRSTKIIVPEQIIQLEPTDNTGRWIGRMIIDGSEFRVEAYAAEGGDETTRALIDDLYVLADMGGPLRRHTMPNGTQAYLTVFPRGA